MTGGQSQADLYHPYFTDEEAETGKGKFGTFGGPWAFLLPWAPSSIKKYIKNIFYNDFGITMNVLILHIKKYYLA